MADVSAFAEIRMWGHTVGGVAELDDGSIVFEYDDAFRRSGLEISPLHLPLTLRGPVEFRDLRRKDAFRGLPGVLADALPDSFGTTVIRAYYTASGEMQKALSPVQHLLYVGARGMGALEFHPAVRFAARSREVEALEIQSLVADARRILAGDASVLIPEIYRIGSSAGGMRPKAVVLFNEASREIRSAFATPQRGDVQCILKFDGVGAGDIRHELGVPQPYNRVEAAYARMARAAGLDVVSIEILESGEGHAHLLIPRFDHPGDSPLHQHTLGGLLHVDYNDVGASSYEEYLRTILRLGMPPAAITEGYRRMVFNVLAVNQDDHVKNLSFHMHDDGTWTLTPAYDLTFARGGVWTAAHQMRVAGKREDIRRADLIHVGDVFGVKMPGRIVDEIADVIAQWRTYASATAVPKKTVDQIEMALHERALQLRG